ncbi:ankyrin repeat domain-containing protein 26-like [Pteropus medius]|uniref:ankyrin repeat domain-containing protein 26-like n=1 Tax=Pteropus vampyrus TaxID=132908 RepID=UPI00196BA3D1|nr:ankyrin repeat domain-containing protein 26-like [Pteropus giganteus]
MKKIFGFESWKGKLPFGSLTKWQRNSIGISPKDGNSTTSWNRYHIQDKDLRKIHRAASAGNAQEMEEILLTSLRHLNDRDRKNRTALHLACANGHPKVVALLADSKCQLNLCDNENKTALIKAVQCQEEECATILLERGADPNIMDIYGNTALHYAVAGQNMDIATKLLSYKANIEARNKNELTPLLLAVSENKQQMVEFLVKRNANVHAVDKVKSNCKLTSENKEERRCKESSQNSNPVNENSEEHSISRLSRKAGLDDSCPESDNKDFVFATKEEATTPAIGKKENVKMSALELGEEEDVESHSDPERFSASLPQKHVDHFSGAADQRGKNIPNGQVEDSPEKYPHLKPTIEVNYPVLLKAVGMEDMQTYSSDSSDSDSASLPLNHETCQRTRDLKVDDKCPFVSQSMTPNQSASTDFGQMTLIHKDKTNSRAMFLIKDYKPYDLCESQLSENGESKEDWSAELSVRMTSEEEQGRLDTSENNHPQVVEGRNDHQKQLCQEQNARILQDVLLTNHLCKQKKIEINLKKMKSKVSDAQEKEKNLSYENHRLHESIAMLNLEIDTVKNQKQEKEKKYFEDITILQEKNDSLQKTIKLNKKTLKKTIFQYNRHLNVLIAEKTTLNSQLENEKQSKERLETEVESYRSRLATTIHDHEQGQTSKRDLEFAFQKARDEWFHFRDKMNFDMSNMKDKNEILSQQLSKAKRELKNLETDLHHTRDALREKTLALEHVQRDLSQTQCQKKEIEHMYQYERGKVNKYVGKQESLEERISRLQSKNMLLRKQLDDALPKAENKEKTIITIQEQFQDTIKRFQAESENQGRILEEKNQKLINECKNLKERMYRYETDKEEREVFVRQLQQELADTLKKQCMSETSLEVTQDLEKKLNQIRSQFQEASDQFAQAIRCAEKTSDDMQKLTIQNDEFKVTIKKQAGRIEHLQTNLLGASLSQVEKEPLKNCTELKQSLEYQLDQEKKKNDELEKEITRIQKLLKITKRKLNEYEKGELSFSGALKPSHIEMDIQINMLKQEIADSTEKLETASSKCRHLDEENQFLRQQLLSMKETQKKCEKLENENEKLKQELVNLKSHIKMNMVKYSEVEHYKQEIEERARQKIVEKLKEVNLFLQTQAASQENLQQLREKNNASIRSQMELRIKDLESELSKVKTSQEDSNKMQLEMYKQLYLEELKVRMSLENKLNVKNERLAEISSELKKQQSRTLLCTDITGPVLEPPGVGSLNHRLISHRNFIPREKLETPASTPWTSNNSLEVYFIKMQREMDKMITKESNEAAAEFEFKSHKPSPLQSTGDLLLNASKEYVQILKKNYML